jgi:hypothetical protein
MKLLAKTFYIVISMCIVFSGNSTVYADLSGPDIRFDAPREGSCWRVTSTSPYLGFRVTAEDPSGVKQMQVWMKEGHHTSTGDISTWMRIQGWTYARDDHAPDNISQSFSIRMLGRPEGEYTLKVEAADMARHNRRWIYFHFSVDNTPPVVRITKPSNNAAICKDFNLNVEISASDVPCGVKKVYVYIDRVSKNTYCGSDNLAPYKVTIPKERFTSSSHKIVALTHDKAGNVTRTEITVKPILICKMIIMK